MEFWESSTYASILFSKTLAKHSIGIVSSNENTKTTSAVMYFEWQRYSHSILNLCINESQLPSLHSAGDSSISSLTKAELQQPQDLDESPAFCDG